LKPSSWADKTSGETRHGLSITVNQSLSPYDITKRKPKPKPDAGSSADKPVSGYPSQLPYNDDLDF